MRIKLIVDENLVFLKLTKLFLYLKGGDCHESGYDSRKDRNSTASPTLDLAGKLIPLFAFSVQIDHFMIKKYIKGI